jgi:predicted phosphodiesterase
MRLAALYDVHGNLPALDAVLEEMRAAHVDRIVVGGDVVPGPMIRAVLARLRDLDMPTDFIFGNGETEVLRASRGEELRRVPEVHRDLIHWAAKQLSADEIGFLATWPMTHRLHVDGIGDVLFCHATPRDDNEVFTKQTAVERLLPLFEPLDVALVVCGHTHMPFDRMVGRTRVVNAGSVGMPFGTPGADWLLLGPEVQLRHTAYDLEAAAQRMRATTYPGVEDHVMRYILNPPSAAHMLQLFESVALR